MAYTPNNPDGQAAMASSAPVVLASDQTAVPVSASSLPLPSGAATSAKQPALGTAGSASADVVSVQGVTSMTALKVDGSGATQPVSAASLPLPSGAAQDATLTGGSLQAQGNVAAAGTDSGNPIKIGGKVNVTRPTYTDGQRGDLQIGTRGAVLVEPSFAGGSTGYLPLADNADGVTVSATLNKLAIQNRNTVFNGTSWDRQYGDATNGTWVNVKAQAALPAGTNTIGDINLTAAARGGYSVSSQTALTTAATVSGAAGKFGGVMFMNLNSAPAYIQVFDTTGAVTLGTTTPTFVIPLPANATAANGVAAVHEFSVGIAIANGIKVAATTTPTGATTVGTGLTGFVLYK